MTTIARHSPKREQAEPPRQLNLFIDPDREQDKAIDDLLEIVSQRLRELQARAKLAQTHESTEVKRDQLASMAVEAEAAALLISQASNLGMAGHDREVST